MCQVRCLDDGHVRPGAPGLGLRQCPAVQLSLDRSSSAIVRPGTILIVPFVAISSNAQTLDYLHNHKSQVVTKDLARFYSQVLSYICQKGSRCLSLAEQRLTPRCVTRARVRAGASLQGASSDGAALYRLLSSSGAVFKYALRLVPWCSYFAIQLPYGMW